MSQPSTTSITSSPTTSASELGVTNRPLRYFFFDLDDCLYPKSSNVNAHVRDRIAQYLSEVLGIENPMEKSVNLYLQHGTTLRGLIHEGYTVDPLTFYHYVHSGFGLDGVTRNDVELHAMISKLKTNIDKLILFTNSDSKHANRLMDHLGITELFDKIVCYEDLELSVKPHPHSYELAAEISGLPSGSTDKHILSWKEMIDNGLLEIYFADDNLKNIMSSIDMGWKACWVCEQGLQGPPNEGIPVIQYITQIVKVWPKLFE